VAAWQVLATRDLAMFVSPSAVERFTSLRPPDVAWPPGTLAGSTGPGTARALRAAGVPVACIVSPADDAPRFDSEALWAILRKRRDWGGASVLVVRGEGGRDWLAAQLRAAGAAVGFVEAYRRGRPLLTPVQQQALAAARAQPAGHVWLFSSSEALGQLTAIAPGADWSTALALATHPRIAEAARAAGFGRVQPVAPSPPAVADAVSALTRSIQSAPT
jgi:uroporphyrinogen-III synthase